MDGSIILGGLILVSLGQLLVLRDHGSYDDGTKAPISNSALQDWPDNDIEIKLSIW